MISERKFAHAYTSFWRVATPFSDAAVRLINSEARNVFPPLINTVLPSRQGYVCETGFQLFALLADVNPSYFDLTFDIARLLEEASALALKYGGLLKHQSDISPLAREEELMASEIAQRLFDWVAHVGSNGFVATPEFRGCGIVDHCRGDILSNCRLCEVKSVERDFRVSDVRQLIIYGALNYASPRYDISEVSLINPKSGYSFTCSINEIARLCSGKDAIDLFADVVDFISSEVPSL